MTDLLLPWAPFFYSFGPSLFIIKILADWFRLRLYFPLRPNKDPDLQAKSLLKATRFSKDAIDFMVRYDKMSYQQLRNKVVHEWSQGKTAELSADKLDYLIRDAIYASKAEKRYHLHHFLFGIPLLFVSWGLFVYGENFWGLIFAGVIAALFLSELKELITQEWQP